MYMDKNYIIYPKDSYTQIEGIDREHLTQQYMFAQLSLMQQFTELLKIQGRKEMKNQNLYNYSSNFPHFIGFPACPLVK